MTNDFGILNAAIVVGFLLANLILGYVLGRRVKNAEDYYFGSKSTPWWAIGISVIATYVSALSFLGGPAWAYTDGLSALAIHLNYPLVIFVVISLFLPFFYNSGVASIYEYQERRFGVTSRSVMSLIFLISQALTTAAILYATALVLQFVTGIDVIAAIIAITLIALVYTAMGGMLAVIWTDVFQATVLLIGAGIIMFALIDNLPVPLADALASLKAEGKLSAIVTSPDITKATTIWSGVIAMTLFHITVYGANQMMVQRTLGAPTIGGAKKAYLLMGFAAFPIYFLFFFVGVLCYSYYGGKPFENSNQIILTFASSAGIPGLMGILTAAVLAASMSTLSSAFNSLATITTIDFYRKFSSVPDGQGHYLKMTRIFTLCWAVIVIVPAIMYSNTQGSILEVLSKIGSFFVGAKLGMYALGFFSKHTTEKGLLVGVAIGFLMVWYVATYTDIAWPWYCAIGGGTNIIVSIIASLILTGKQENWSPYTVVGQRQKFADTGEAISQDGWYRLPGRVDRISWLLIIFFVVTVAGLKLFELAV